MKYIEELFFKNSLNFKLALSISNFLCEKGRKEREKESLVGTYVNG